MRDSPAEISLVIAVYNRADALRLVLTALERQTFRSFEAVIADDGSGEEVGKVVSEFRARLFFPIIHVRQDDRGWRKNAALNAAVRRSRASYLVFIDGDCVPHHRFLEDHWAERAARTFLCGRRVELSPALTRDFTEENVRSGRFERFGLRGWWEAVLGRAVRVEDGIRLRRPFLARILHGDMCRMLGSNFSLYRVDLEAINGFDERYEGPGCGEDSDVQFRLELSGCVGKSLRHRAVQYHLWHPVRRVSEASIRRFEEVRRMRAAWCEEGLFRAGAAGAAVIHGVPARGDAGRGT
ncbi:MAG: glycosyltransferase [Bacteroidota bacterium]|nr:glycosyltransferase [Bacteroidota bacterium]